MTTLKPATAAVGRLLLAKGADGLTPAEARAELHIDRLAPRIHELKAAGWVIDTVLEQTGDGTRYARYVGRAPHRPRPLRGHAGSAGARMTATTHSTPPEVHATHLRLQFTSANCEWCSPPRDSQRGARLGRRTSLPVPVVSSAALVAATTT